MTMGDHDHGLMARVRPYALTGGRTRTTVELPLEALVRSTESGIAALPRLMLEQRKIAELCASPVSVAEVSAHLRVPLGVARVLVGDMKHLGLVDTNQVVLAHDRPDVTLLERVLDGLKSI